MVLEWREREHEEVDAAMDQDLVAQVALKICGLYNFWALKGMRAQVSLLEMLVGYWDPNSKRFILDRQPLRIELEYIYFLTGLSHQGEVVDLKSRGAGSGMKVKEYIEAHCVVGTPMVGIQIPIWAIGNLILKIIVLMLTMIIGLASLHQALRLLMFYALECVSSTIYDWCTSLLTNMKGQLIECKKGGKRNFGFASILCSLFFERVPSLGPRVEIIPIGPCDPAMARWIEVMRWQGGGRVVTPYNDDVFFWWRRQIIALDDYPYVGIDFIGDPDMLLPPGVTYGTIGKKFLHISFFCIFAFK
jgi:hypothetical protein